MYNFAKRNGVKVTKSLVPWWLRKIYNILDDRFTSKMATTSSIVPDNNQSDPAVCVPNTFQFRIFYSFQLIFIFYVSFCCCAGADEIDGCKSICNEKDDCPRYARYCIANGKCISIEVHTASWRASWILYVDVDTDKRVDNYAGE